jgi:hypothetical protein
MYELKRDVQRWLARKGIGGFYLCVCYDFDPPYPPAIIFGPYPSDTLGTQGIQAYYSIGDGAVFMRYYLRNHWRHDVDGEQP